MLAIGVILWAAYHREAKIIVTHSTSAALSEVAGNVLTDAQVAAAAQQLLSHLARSPEVQQSVTDMVREVLAHETTRTQLAALLQHPTVVKSAVDLLRQALGTSEVQGSAVQLVRWILAQPEVIDAAAVAASKALADPRVVQAASDGMRDAGKTTLASTDIQEAGKGYVTHLLEDEEVKSAAAATAWSVTARALTPTIFRSNKRPAAPGSAAEDEASVQIETVAPVEPAEVGVDMVSADRSEVSPAML